MDNLIQQNGDRLLSIFNINIKKLQKHEFYFLRNDEKTLLEDRRW